MKTVYLIRHSKPGNCSFIYRNSDLQTKNEKKKLTKEGKKKAKLFFENEEFKNIKEIYSSNYLRAIQTAKILGKIIKKDVKIVSDFGERIIGVKSWDLYPKDYEIHQFNDNNYKIENGESLNDVRKRFLNALNDILDETSVDTFAVISHSTGIMILLKNWCDISYDSNYSFKNKVFFDGKWNYCETFKLEFNEKRELISIENIKQ